LINTGHDQLELKINSLLIVAVDHQIW